MARLTTAILCDYASARDGLLHIIGGAVTRLTRAPLPAPFGIYVAMIVELEPDELELAHEARIVVTQPDRATPIFQATAAFLVGLAEVEPGESLPVPLAVPLAAVVEEYGRYDVRINVDDEFGGLLTAYARPARPPASPATPE